MEKLILKKIRQGKYKAIDGKFTIEIDLYEGKWTGGLYEDGDQIEYWEGDTKKEIMSAVKAYFAM